MLRRWHSVKDYNMFHRVAKEDEKWIKYFQDNYSRDVRQKAESEMCIDAGCSGTNKGVKFLNKNDHNQQNI